MGGQDRVDIGDRRGHAARGNRHRARCSVRVQEHRRFCTSLSQCPHVYMGVHADTHTCAWACTTLWGPCPHVHVGRRSVREHATSAYRPESMGERACTHGVCTHGQCTDTVQASVVAPTGEQQPTQPLCQAQGFGSPCLPAATVQAGLSAAVWTPRAGVGPFEWEAVGCEHGLVMDTTLMAVHRPLHPLSLCGPVRGVPGEPPMGPWAWRAPGSFWVSAGAKEGRERHRVQQGAGPILGRREQCPRCGDPPLWGLHGRRGELGIEAKNPPP